MSRLFFSNPFPDCPDEADDLKDKFTLKLNEKWQSTLARLKNIESRDYSVYTGTSGIALLQLKKDPENVENLKEVKEMLPLNSLKNKVCTFLCGDAGALALRTVVDYKLADKAYEDCIKRLRSIGDQVLDVNSSLPNEFLYGRAGYLYAVLYVNKHIDPAPFQESFIRQIIESILFCGKNEAKAGNFKCPLMYQWHDSYYLGAAHGVSGILYLLLQAKDYLTDTELNTLIKPTIDYLSTLRFPSGNFPSSIGRDSDSKVQWCHGAPGFVFLYCMAHKVFGNAKYLQIALECGDVVWTRGLLRKGYSLCHGVAGNGYCFLELYQTTQDKKHLFRAQKFADWCLKYTKANEEHAPDRPLSLFEGISGPMYFLLDMQNPLDAKFPGFTL